MKSAKKPVLIFSSVVWNFYKTRPHEIALGLCEAGRSVVFVEPLRYVDGSSTRLQEVSHNDPKTVQILSRSSRLRKGPLLLFVENWRNVLLVFRLKPHAVISGDIWMSIGVAAVCQLRKIPFFFDNMDYWPGVEKSRFMKGVVKNLLYPYYALCSTAVFNTSHFLTDYMQRHTKASVYLPNGKSQGDCDAAEQLYRQQRQNKKKNRVVFIATLRDWYDYDLLIAVFTSFPHIQLDIYGDGPMKEALIKKTAQCPNITVHGPVASTRVPSLIAESDFGVLPLRNIEAVQGVMPIKLLDYWAAHKAVLSTVVGDMATLAVNGGCVLGDSAKSWQATIGQWYTKPDTLQAVGERGRARLLQEFTYSTLITQIDRFLAEHS